MSDEPVRRGIYPAPITVERRQSQRMVGEHTHRQPRWPIITVTVMIVVLTVAVMVLAFAVVQLYRYRDQQAQAIQESVTDALCDVLDVLRAGGRLDQVRERYGCGPGMLPPPPNP
jgi:hypothetical protein